MSFCIKSEVKCQACQALYVPGTFARREGSIAKFSILAHECTAEKIHDEANLGLNFKAKRDSDRR